jgi:methyl halide transferase
METILTSNQPEFWQTRYQAQQTPWDLGQVAPPFKVFVETHQTQIKPGKLAVLGAGNGHDAAFFGQQGFDVTGFDFAPDAVSGATARYGDWARFVQADIFNLDSAYEQQFDYVVEHTCFCAIWPKRRQEYVATVNRLLKPGGYFIGLIWAFLPDDGPPYPSTPEEIQTLFLPIFECQRLELTPHSVDLRQNQELFCLFQKRV